MKTVSTHTYHWNLPFNDNNFELQVSCPLEVAEWLDKKIGQENCVDDLQQHIRELEDTIEQMVDAKNVFVVWELANQTWQRILDRQEPPR